MPKRTTGTGGSKAPVRGLTSLLRELDPTTKNILNSAFADAENLLDFHNRTVPQRQTRRRIAGLVKTLEVRGESNLLGGFLTWKRLDDPRISFYEVQTSDDNVFANPESFQVIEMFFGLENLRTIKYCRVRGVRADGQTGLWSNTVTLRPRISAPAVYSLDFYQRYFGAEPNLRRFLRFSGGNAKTHPEFYTVLSGSFYADRLIGGLSIWGYLSTRLEKYMNGSRTPWDRVRFKVNNVSRLDGYFPHWTNVYDEVDFHSNDRDTSNRLMHFYARGGYTASFGPYAVTLPNTVAGFGPNDAHSVVNRDVVDGAFYWRDPMNAARASRFDEAQLVTYNSTRFAHEAHADAIIEGGKTDYLVFRDFRFNIPADSVVSGLKAQVKRRQPNIINEVIGANYGVLRPDRALGHDYVLETNTGIAGASRFSVGNIINDVSFGRFLDFTCGRTSTAAFQSGLMRHDVSGDSDDTSVTVAGTKLFTSNRWSMSCWVRAPSPLLAYHTGTLTSFVAFPEATNAPVAADIRFQLTTNATTNVISNMTFQLQNSPGQVYLISLVPSGTLGTINVWHHIAVTYDSTIGLPGLMRMYVDGIDRTAAATVTISSTLGALPFRKNIFTGNTNWTMPIGTTLPTQGQSILHKAHFGIWNKVLTAADVRELWEARGRVDYRQNFGEYRSADFLNHYFLTFPEQTDIRDLEVRLVDQTGPRTDLDNKAITTESWPQLGNFFYHNLRLYNFLPLGVSNGIPHDNHTAIGYQDYGSETDRWGGTWTPTAINSFYFGLAVRATNQILLGYRGGGFIDHAKLTVYTVPRIDRQVDVELQVAVSNEFYAQREVFGAIMNLIELGERLAEAND